MLVVLAASLLPLRLAKLVARGAVNALRAGQGGEYLRTLPVVASGQAAWLAGESSFYARWLAGSTATD